MFDINTLNILVIIILHLWIIKKLFLVNRLIEGGMVTETLIPILSFDVIHIQC